MAKQFLTYNGLDTILNGLNTRYGKYLLLSGGTMSGTINSCSLVPLKPSTGVVSEYALGTASQAYSALYTNNATIGDIVVNGVNMDGTSLATIHFRSKNTNDTSEILCNGNSMQFANNTNVFVFGNLTSNTSDTATIKLKPTIGQVLMNTDYWQIGNTNTYISTSYDATNSLYTTNFYNPNYILIQNANGGTFQIHNSGNTYMNGVNTFINATQTSSDTNSMWKLKVTDVSTNSYVEQCDSTGLYKLNVKDSRVTSTNTMEISTNGVPETGTVSFKMSANNGNMLLQASTGLSLFSGNTMQMTSTSNMNLISSAVLLLHSVSTTYIRSGNVSEVTTETYGNKYKVYDNVLVLQNKGTECYSSIYPRQNPDYNDNGLIHFGSCGLMGRAWSTIYGNVLYGGVSFLLGDNFKDSAWAAQYFCSNGIQKPTTELEDSVKHFSIIRRQGDVYIQDFNRLNYSQNDYDAEESGELVIDPYRGNSYLPGDPEIDETFKKEFTIRTVKSKSVDESGKVIYEFQDVATYDYSKDWSDDDYWTLDTETGDDEVVAGLKTQWLQRFNQIIFDSKQGSIHMDKTWQIGNQLARIGTLQNQNTRDLVIYTNDILRIIAQDVIMSGQLRYRGGFKWMNNIEYTIGENDGFTIYAGAGTLTLPKFEVVDNYARIIYVYASSTMNIKSTFNSVETTTTLTSGEGAIYVYYVSNGWVRIGGGGGSSVKSITINGDTTTKYTPDTNGNIDITLPYLTSAQETEIANLISF